MGALDLLPVDDFAEGLLPSVFIEARDTRLEKEVVRQSAIVLHLRKHATRCMVWSVPNAAREVSNKLWQAREGAWYGAADLTVAWAGGVAFIEVKGGKTAPRRNQVEFLNMLARRGHHVAVVRSVEGATRFLAGVGAPVPLLR